MRYDHHSFSEKLEILKKEPRFHLFTAMVEEFLEAHYPEDVFSGEGQDKGSKFVSDVRGALKDLYREEV